MCYYNTFSEKWWNSVVNTGKYCDVKIKFILKKIVKKKL